MTNLVSAAKRLTSLAKQYGASLCGKAGSLGPCSTSILEGTSSWPKIQARGSR